jgi:hypothetical protein
MVRLTAPESLKMEMMKHTAPAEAVGCTIDGGQAAIMGILVKDSANVFLAQDTSSVTA